jgi:hypothetical protein
MKRIEDIKLMTEAELIAEGSLDGPAARKARMDAALAENDILNSELVRYRMTPFMSYFDGDQWSVTRQEDSGVRTEVAVCMSQLEAWAKARELAETHVRIWRKETPKPKGGIRYLAVVDADGTERYAYDDGRLA